MIFDRRLIVFAAFLSAVAAPLHAQTATTGATKGRAESTRIARPTWNELTPAQRDALAPLAQEWDSFERERKQKWLEVAKNYPQLSAEGKARMHQRMAEFVKLTPEQRRNVRENFRRAYELPADQRQALIQEYKDLPPEKKQELSDKARPTAAEPAKTSREVRRRTASDVKSEDKTR